MLDLLWLDLSWLDLDLDLLLLSESDEDEPLVDEEPGDADPCEEDLKLPLLLDPGEPTASGCTP